MSKNRNKLPERYNPVGYGDLIREVYRESPKDVDGVFNASSVFYNRELLRLIFSAYEFTGVPAEWDYDYMLTHIFVDGMFAITDTEVGVIPLRCGVTGVNYWDHPTEVQIAVPVLGSMRRKIGEECALVKLQYDYKGVMELVQRYATNLSMCDSSIAVNLMNTKAVIIGQAEDAKQAQTLKKMYDEISAGKPFVVTRNGMVKIGESVIFNPVKQAFVADEVQLLKRKIMNEFLTRIGIGNANTEKRERLISDEVNANNEESEVAKNHWVKTVNEGLKEANRLYGLSLGFRQVQVKTEATEGGDGNEPE